MGLHLRENLIMISLLLSLLLCGQIPPEANPEAQEIHEPQQPKITAECKIKILISRTLEPNRNWDHDFPENNYVLVFKKDNGELREFTTLNQWLLVIKPEGIILRPGATGKLISYDTAVDQLVITDNLEDNFSIYLV